MTSGSSQLGKVDRRFLESVVFRNLGATNPSVVVGPGHGRDNSVIDLGNGRVLILTSDPLSFIPSLGAEESAWLTVQLLASDFTTSGVSPQFAVFDFNLPPELDMEDFTSYVKAIGLECKRLGVSIVGGHTGKYPGSNFTIIGGGVLFGTARSDEFLTPSMAGQGDKVIMTKGAAIATTGVLSRAFPGKVGDQLGPGVLRKANSYLRLCSTVKEALLASSVGKGEAGVTSMHDATEGGVLGGLYELSSACGRIVLVHREEIYIAEETRQVCALFGLDPLTTLSEGTLILTCRPKRAEKIARKLRDNGIPNFAIGEIGGKAAGGLRISDGRKTPERFVPPSVDPYWSAYATAIRRGWT